MESFWVRTLAPPLVTGHEDKGHKACENRRGSYGVTGLDLGTQDPYVLWSLCLPLFSPHTERHTFSGPGRRSTRPAHTCERTPGAHPLTDSQLYEAFKYPHPTAPQALSAAPPSAPNLSATKGPTLAVRASSILLQARQRPF